MIKKYVASLAYRNTIKIVEVEKETGASVWVKGRRNAKRSSYENYFDTWREAHDCLREDAERNLSRAKKSLEQARSRLEVVKQIKPIT